MYGSMLYARAWMEARGLLLLLLSLEVLLTVGLSLGRAVYVGCASDVLEMDVGVA